MREPPRRWLVGTRVEAYHPGWPHRDGTPGPNFRPAIVVDQTPGGDYVRCRWDEEGWEGVTYHLNVRLPGEPDPVKAMRTWTNRSHGIDPDYLGRDS